MTNSPISLNIFYGWSGNDDVADDNNDDNDNNVGTACWVNLTFHPFVMTLSTQKEKEV